jgi:2-polyprenyl-3-methyl-5-hydroxy-6-metoxy-1,4-benzoquinol methylase
MTQIEQVKEFWNSNPLWSGESKFEIGTKDFFEEHRTVYIADCFGGKFDERFLPPPRANDKKIKVLDLGCGIGFWTIEFGLRGNYELYSADLTQTAIDNTSKRCQLYNINSSFSIQNAEELTFENKSFDHVNCQGVIHHTPNTERTVAEIARVLNENGTASISVYYKNIFLRSWPFIRWVGKLFFYAGAKLRGRGRENIFAQNDVNEIVRLYDGKENPIGKSYSKKEFIELLSDYFIVEEIYLHFFPARSLPFKIPKSIHAWLDKKFGFMIYANLRKKCVG